MTFNSKDVMRAFTNVHFLYVANPNNLIFLYFKGPGNIVMSRGIMNYLKQYNKYNINKTLLPLLDNFKRLEKVQ